MPLLGFDDRDKNFKEDLDINQASLKEELDKKYAGQYAAIRGNPEMQKQAKEGVDANKQIEFDNRYKVMKERLEQHCFPEGGREEALRIAQEEQKRQQAEQERQDAEKKKVQEKEETRQKMIDQFNKASQQRSDLALENGRER